MPVKKAKATTKPAAKKAPARKATPAAKTSAATKPPVKSAPAAAKAKATGKAAPKKAAPKKKAPPATPSAKKATSPSAKKAKTVTAPKAAAKPARTPDSATTSKAKSQKEKRTVPKKSKSQIKVYRNRLQELGSQLMDEVKVLSDNSLTSNKQAGEELADIGSDNFLRDMELSLMGEESKRIRLIQDALERLDNGTYGVCLDCDAPIPEGRLEALPYAKLCVTCKSRREELEAEGIYVEDDEELEITE